MMNTSVQSFLDFIKRAPSAFHAVDEFSRMAEAEGFIRLTENQAWNLEKGGRYYVTRNQSAILAFEIPEEAFSSFQIVASHSDSPSFKVKPFAEESAAGGHYIRLNTEKYGGMIMSTWMDRPLSLAGRVMVRTENGIESRLVNLDEDLVLIPNVPIHFNRDINTGYSFNPQVDMLPLFGDGNAQNEWMKRIAVAAGTEEKNVIGTDLFLYNRDAASVWGANGEFFSCRRIDDLECAFTSMKALFAAKAKGHVNVCAVFDNEEVGSGSKQGADSTLLNDVLTRVGCAFGMDAAQIRAAMASSFMVSADNAHAVHPNHSEKYDAQNRAYMNGGIVIKHNANQKYTTDGASCAVFATICEKAKVPVQHFANRSDVAGGSTLGNISTSHVSVNTVDIGLAQLAMHSCYETAGTADLDYMISALRCFYDTHIAMEEDGRFCLS